MSEEYIAALLREREGYVREDKSDRIKDVDAALKAAGYSEKKEEGGYETAVAEPVAETAVVKKSRGRPAKK